MSKSPETRRTLLLRIRDADNTSAWNEFVAIYAPLLHAYGMKRGLQDADAADLTQTVLQSVARGIHQFQYDRGKGTFRGWLFTVARNHLLKLVEKRKRIATASGETSVQEMLSQQPDETSDEDIWNAEHEKRLFAWAVNKVRPEFTESTWNAFWSAAMEGKKPAEIARAQNISVGAVYIAKSRVTSRIRDEIQALEQDQV